ncbi:MAG: YdiY family protein [Acidiferrobacterales bacterium]
MRKQIQFIVACLLLVSSNAFAIVNVENIRVEKREDGFSGQLRVLASLQNGNTNNNRVGLGSRLQWIRGNITNFLVLNYDYGNSGGATDINKSFLHGRHIVQQNEKWAWEGFGQLAQDEFKRLSIRMLAGAGVRLTLSEKTHKGAMYLGLGTFYSTEKLDDNSTSSLFRASTYFVYKYSLNPNTHFISTTYYQPALSDPGDFRALQQAGFNVAISKTLDLKLSLDISYDNQPPIGVESTDTSFRTGIEYRF